MRRALPDFPPGLTEPGTRFAVRVEVTIAADGIAIPRLAQSSGDPDVDRCVLAALRRWTWRPATKGGAAVSSVETFRYDFEVN